MKVLGVTLFAAAMVAVAIWIGGTMPHERSQASVQTVAATAEGGKLLPVGEGERVSSNGTKRMTNRRPNGPYIVIDRYSNKLFLRTEDSVLLETSCSTGSGGELVDPVSGRHWRFITPAGVFVVDAMLRDPWWRKPDWAFVEEGLPLPKNDTERMDDQMMGDYAIGFGDGYFIHGTLYERLLGVAVTHGCIRVGATDLKKLYENTHIGTLVYVF